MNRNRWFLTLTSIVMLALAAVLVFRFNGRVVNPVRATDKSTPTLSTYRTLLDQEIRGIDPQTVEAYRSGAGLGLALPAELNGYPGPRHVLDLSQDLELTQTQQTQIQALFDEMQPQAIRLGEALLAVEADLERAFREHKLDEASLQAQLEQAGELQAQLRFVHLRTHLATIEILSPQQIEQYNRLRGYETSGNDHLHHHE